MDAQVAEQSSRRNAMEKASDNADELIDKLQLEFNKTRQANITQEIAEIIGGSQS
jgi:F-type H+-transporting ATPase subunit gamma